MKFIPISLRSASSKMAFFFFGLLLGTGIASPVSFNRIHQLTQEIHTLEIENTSLTKQIKKYEEMLPQRGTVQSDRISFFFRNEIPDYVKSSLTREVLERLSPHIGKDLAKLDPLLLEQALDGQVFVVEQTEWEVKVHSIRITDQLEFSLGVREK